MTAIVGRRLPSHTGPAEASVLRCTVDVRASPPGTDSILVLVREADPAGAVLPCFAARLQLARDVEIDRHPPAGRAGARCDAEPHAIGQAPRDADRRPAGRVLLDVEIVETGRLPDAVEHAAAAAHAGEARDRIDELCGLQGGEAAD